MLCAISTREKEVPYLIANKHILQEFPPELYISIHTAIHYLKHLIEKVGVKNLRVFARILLEEDVHSILKAQH